MHDEVSYAKENGSVSGKSSFQYPAYRGDEPLPSSLEQARFQDPRVDRSRPSGADLAALKELVRLHDSSCLLLAPTVIYLYRYIIFLLLKVPRPP